MNTIDTNVIDKELQACIRATGSFILTEFQNFSTSQVEYKGRNNPVSYVDRKAEDMLKAVCTKLIPGSGFVNEESEDQESENGYVWIIDPLDGTKNFVFGIPFFAISLALQYEGELEMGYVYEVSSDEMFSAIRGKGSKLNSKAISVSSASDLSESLFATGFPYVDDKAYDSLEALRIFMARSQGIRRLGSAALDLAYVAAGRFQGYYEAGLNAWDVAAGILLVTEAGGRVTDFYNKNDFLFGRTIIATNSLLHDDVMKIINETTYRN